jgi:hypothetical protein
LRREPTVVMTSRTVVYLLNLKSWLLRPVVRGSAAAPSMVYRICST